MKQFDNPLQQAASQMLHLDNEGWFESEHFHCSIRILIKSKRDSGMKLHIFFEDGTIKTLRYLFIRKDRLLEKAKRLIDARLKSRL